MSLKNKPRVSPKHLWVYPKNKTKKEIRKGRQLFFIFDSNGQTCHAQIFREKLEIEAENIFFNSCDLSKRTISVSSFLDRSNAS